MESFLVDDTDSEVKRMKKELNSAIAKLQAVEGEEAEKIGALLDKQLPKLGDIEDRVNSSMEGVIFEHPPGSKKLYKLTGSFRDGESDHWKSQKASQRRRTERELAQKLCSIDSYRLIDRGADERTQQAFLQSLTRQYIIYFLLRRVGELVGKHVFKSFVISILNVATHVGSAYWDSFIRSRATLSSFSSTKS